VTEDEGRTGGCRRPELVVPHDATEILEEFDHDPVFSSYDFLYLAVHGKLTFHGRTVQMVDDISAE
jgi:hypothetical protein